MRHGQLLLRRKALVDRFPFVVADELLVTFEIHAVVAAGELAGFMTSVPSATLRYFPDAVRFPS